MGSQAAEAARAAQLLSRASKNSIPMPIRVRATEVRFMLAGVVVALVVTRMGGRGERRRSERCQAWWWWWCA